MAVAMGGQLLVYEVCADRGCGAGCAPLVYQELLVQELGRTFSPVEAGHWMA